MKPKRVLKVAVDETTTAEPSHQGRNAVLLLIVGCPADPGECRELPAPVPVYETVEECDAELVWDTLPGGYLTASVEPFDGSDVLVASNGAGRTGGSAAAR